MKIGIIEDTLYPVFYLVPETNKRANYCVEVCQEFLAEYQQALEHYEKLRNQLQDHLEIIGVR